MQERTPRRPRKGAKTPATVRNGKLSVSLGDEITAWLRRVAQNKRSNVSQVLREICAPHFDKRSHKQFADAASA